MTIQKIDIIISIAFILSRPLIFTGYCIYDFMKKRNAKKVFMNTTSEYVKMLIYRKSCGSHSRIYIFSVNGDPPAYGKRNDLLLPIGRNEIKAHLEPLVDHPMINYMARNMARRSTLTLTLKLANIVRPPEENSIIDRIRYSSGRTV